MARGDSLGKISRKFDCDMKQLAKAKKQLKSLQSQLNQIEQLPPDQQGLLAWYGQFRDAPPLALVHGEDRAREALAGEIGERFGTEAILARPGLRLEV